MYAIVKKIEKPIQKKDFYLPSGEPVLPNMLFREFRGRQYNAWKFKYLSVGRAMELAEDGELIIRRRNEIKAELRRSFRSGGKVASETKHLASIMDRDVSDPIKCEAFWRKIDDKLKTFELSQEEEINIRAKIEADVPRSKS